MTNEMLSEPGFWEIDAEDYHRDPAPEPSLSQSIGKDLLEFCPRTAWWHHPRLNPQFVPEDDSKFDLGTAAHRMLLGKGREFKTVDAPTWQGKEAKMLRDAYRQAGFVPILVHQHDNCLFMVEAARKQLPLIEGGRHAFNPEFGDIEMCALVRDVTGVWARSLIDFYGAKVPDGVVCWDYKTTSGSANPAALKGQFNRLGWAFQAAFQERLITQIKPSLAGRLKFRFLVQENEEPYLCSVIEPDSEARTIAHKQVAAAFAIWKACLERNIWPAYPRAAVALGIYPGAEAAWLARELDDEMIQLAGMDPYLCGPTAPLMISNANPAPASRPMPERVHALTSGAVKLTKAGVPQKKRGPKPKPKPTETLPGLTILSGG
jgi:hypothetical protein